MGKRSKKGNIGGAAESTEGHKRTEANLANKSDYVQPVDVSEITLTVSPTCEQQRKKSKRKIQQNVLDTNTLENTSEITNDSLSPKKQCPSKKGYSDGKSNVPIQNANEKIKKMKSNVEPKPKKVIFVNDEPQEVSTHNTSKVSKRKSNFNEEDEIKEEDIDQFCDDLTQEDNKQFDDWVKLIEDKLHAKKAK